MLKKSLLLAAISAISVSGLALAQGEEFAPMPAATNAGFNPGFVVGLQGGLGDTAWDNVKNGNDPSVSGRTGIAGRVFVGYDFHQNFGTEFGYTLFGERSKIKGVYSNRLTYNYADVRTQAFDLVGKIKAPLDNDFTVYAKAGISYLMSSGLRKSSFPAAAGTDGYMFADDKQDNFNLVYGLGAGYNVTPNFMVDLSWTRFNGNPLLESNTNGQATKYQPNADLYAIGVSYKFDI